MNNSTVIVYSAAVPDREEFKKSALLDKLNELLSDKDTEKGFIGIIKDFLSLDKKMAVDIGEVISIRASLKVNQYDSLSIQAFMIFMRMKGFNAEYDPITSNILLGC